MEAQKVTTAKIYERKPGMIKLHKKSAEREI